MKKLQINGDKKENKGRILVVGDIHGAAKALQQCLDTCKFDKEIDTLIVLGDIVDGWSDVYNVLEILIALGDSVIYVIGNHDQWFLDYLNTGVHPCEWRQGADATRLSYLRSINKEDMIWESDFSTISALNPGDIPQSHKDFFNKGVYLYIDKNICFVHGGFDREYSIDKQDKYILMWDRQLWEEAQSCTGDQKLKTIDQFSKIFIGHSTCYSKKNPLAKPMFKGGVWNLDTGAGFTGKLTIMDVNTEEYWQSYWLKELYPNEKGRN